MRVLSFVFLLIVLANADTSASREHSVECSPSLDCSEAALFGDTFDWQNEGPLEFLDQLYRVPTEPKGAVVPYTVIGRHYGWIQPGDIPELMKRINSEESCVPVHDAPAEVRGSFRSTVGHEALYLIQGYRAGVYPPEGLSTDWQADMEELRRWYERFSRDATESN